jgi:hypothetical protein
MNATELVEQQVGKKRAMVTNVSLGGNEHSSFWALACEYDGARYHVWIDVRTGELAEYTTAEKPTLYKNCALAIKYGQPGHFKTRKLDPTTKENSAIVVAMFAEMIEHGLVAAERQRIAAEAEAQRIANQKARTLKAKQEAGEALFDQLRNVLAALETYTPNGARSQPWPPDCFLPNGDLDYEKICEQARALVAAINEKSEH